MSSASPADALPTPTELLVTLDDPAQRSSLRGWLTRSDELRGRFDVVPAGAQPGELGGELEVVRLLLESGGVVTVLIESIVLWLRSRRSDVSVEVSVGHNKVTVSGSSLRNASAEDLEKLARSLTQDLTGK